MDSVAKKKKRKKKPRKLSEYPMLTHLNEEFVPPKGVEHLCWHIHSHCRCLHREVAGTKTAGYPSWTPGSHTCRFPLKNSHQVQGTKILSNYRLRFGLNVDSLINEIQTQVSVGIGWNNKSNVGIFSPVPMCWWKGRLAMSKMWSKLGMDVTTMVIIF